MRVHRHSGLTESNIQNHICRFAADPRQGLKRLPRTRHSAAILLDQNLAGGDQMPGLAAVESDRSDVFAQTLFAEDEDFLRCICYREKSLGGLIDADIGRLSGEQDGSQQFKHAGVLQFCLRGWIDGLQGLKEN